MPPCLPTSPPVSSQQNIRNSPPPPPAPAPRTRTMPIINKNIIATISILLLIIITIPSCKKSPAENTRESINQTITIYCSVDQVYAEKLIAEFEKSHPDITIQTRFDTETTKTTGLVQRLRTERANPQADLFWSSEIFQTISLAHENILASFDSPQVHDWPETYRDKDRRWYAFAARARVIAYDPTRTTDPPTYWRDLADPKYKNRIAMADPVFGTTRGHIATWYTLWGKNATNQFLHQLKQNNIRIVVSNSQAVRELLQHSVDFAITDTDDVHAANRNGNHLAIVYPRHGPNPHEGTLLIPNTLAFIAGRPQSPALRSFAEFILSEESERLLYQSDARNIPIIFKKEIAVDPALKVPDPLEVEYDVVAENMNAAVKSAVQILNGK